MVSSIRVKVTKSSNAECWYKDYIGEIIEVTECLNGDECYEVVDWRRYDDGSCEDVCGLSIDINDCKVVNALTLCKPLVERQEDQWLNLETAEKLCFKGFNVNPRYSVFPKSHMFAYNGKLLWYNEKTDDIEDVAGILECQEWELWNRPWESTPKFSIGEFVEDIDGNYGRVINIESGVYSLSDNADGRCSWKCNESQIIAVGGDEPE